MEYIIQNEKLTISVSTKGGELQSIKSKDGTEYLWQGDINTWPDKAINIFPYIARLTNGTYKYRGKQYHMSIHGFLPYSEMTLFSKETNKLTLKLSDTEETFKMYPFHFEYFLHYELCENQICIAFEVKNKDNKTMYFGLGGHPGFNVPLEKGLSFEDYKLEFSEKSSPYRIGFSDTCFVTGEREPYELKDELSIPLSHNLFDKDAIVLCDMCREVTLKSEKGTKSVKVSYPDMDYLGLWHVPNTEVNYVCIEPWSSLPSREGVIENIEKQENLITLEAGKTYVNRWTVEIV